MAAKSFRDRTVTASLKHADILAALHRTGRFRDRTVTASLKRSRRGPEESRLACFRDRMVTASLKHLALPRPAARPHERFRDRTVTASLKPEHPDGRGSALLVSVTERSRPH